MSKISIVISIKEFYIYIEDILERHGALMFIEKKTINNSYESFIMNDQNMSELVDSYNVSCNVHFYITTSKVLQNNKVNNFYSEETYCESIEGTGGRESRSETELITLRLLSKESNKEIKMIFNSIKAKLKKDNSFGKGLKSGVSLYKNDIYPISYVNNRIMIIDMSRKDLSSPLVPILDE